MTTRRPIRDRALLLLLAPLLAVGAGCREAPDPGAPATPEAKPRSIAVIPKGTTHVFWKAVERGARRAADEHGAAMTWKGPLKENDRGQQIQVVQQFIAQGVDGIVLAPLDLHALVEPVREATARGIPVVIFDSALEGEPGRDFVAFVATNNRAAGGLAAERLAGTMSAGGRVVLMRYLVGSASTTNREEGFLEAIGDHPGVEIAVDNRYAGATAGEAKTQALTMIDRIRDAQGIFCSNESATLGMLLALRQEGLAGRIPLVGFDASPPLVEALRAGEIDALVVQDPDAMGRLAVDALLRHLAGEAVEPVTDTGAVLVTRENLDDPAVRRLLE